MGSAVEEGVWGWDEVSGWTCAAAPNMPPPPASFFLRFMA